MGVKGLLGLVKTHAPTAKQTIPKSDLRGNVIAIDAMLFLYKSIIGIRQTGKDLTDSSGRITSHLYKIFQKTISLLRDGIFPIFVFDGRPPSIKRRQLKQRRDTKKKAIKKLESSELLTKEEKIRYFKRSFQMKPYIIKDCQRLLDLLGIPYVQAPEEADSQCAALAISKDSPVTYVATEDADILAFKSSILVGFMNEKTVTNVNIDIILSSFGINFSQFIDLCILMGTDYCPTIAGIGPTLALAGMKKHKTMESFLDELKYKNEIAKDENKPPPFRIPNDFMDKRNETRNYYIYNALVIEPKEISFKWKECRLEETIEFLCKERDFEKRFVVNNLYQIQRLRCITQYPEDKSSIVKKRKLPRKFDRRNKWR